MPPITNGEIEELVRLFDRREVKFYHACQLRDLLSYIELGGVPSRNKMQQSDSYYTEFDTDEADQQNEVWTLVFGNLQDFGNSFAYNQSEPPAPVPNPFGPITLVFSPSVFSQANDAAICLRSAGGRNFDRARESLASVDDVERIFLNTYDPNAGYKNARILFSDRLKEEFNGEYGINQNSNTLNPEVSCDVDNEVLLFDDLIYVIVDEIHYDGTHLRDVVEQELSRHGIRRRVVVRRYRDEGRKNLLDDLVQTIFDGCSSTEEIREHDDASGPLIRWVSDLSERGLDWQLNRYIRYLATGTVQLLTVDE